MKGFTAAALALFVSSAVSADVARVCQSSGPYAPPLPDCQGYKDAVAKKYPNGTIFQDDYYSACTTIYAKNNCRIALCAFPKQGLNSSLLASVVDDVLDNCQTKQGNAVTPSTGGYNIIKGTNITVGVFGSLVPFNVHPTVTTGDVNPRTSDCANIYNNLPRNANYTQNDASGCTKLATNSSCSLSYCDTFGAQLNGWELVSYLGPLFLGVTQGKSTGGYTELSQAYTKRLGFYGTLQPVTVSSDVVNCYNSTTGTPQSQHCQNAANNLTATYGSTITQDQANAGCKVIAKSGSCQINLCGRPGTQVQTQALQASIKSIISNCPVGAKGAEGFAKIANSYATVNIEGLALQRNIWCNASPNNSPKLADAFNLQQSIDPDKIYRSYPQASPQGCHLLLRNGTAKLNLCSSTNAAISGRDLKDIAFSTLFNCQSGDYTGGIAQVNPYTNISLYDPPADTHLPGSVNCDSPATGFLPGYDLCATAYNVFSKELDDDFINGVQLPGPDTTKWVYRAGQDDPGWCELQVSGGDGSHVVPLRYVQAWLEEILNTCVHVGSGAGTMGVRNSEWGDWQVRIAGGSTSVATTEETDDETFGMNYANDKRSMHHQGIQVQRGIGLLHNISMESQNDKRAVSSHKIDFDAIMLSKRALSYKRLGNSPLYFATNMAGGIAQRLTDGQLKDLALGVAQAMQNAPAQALQCFYSFNSDLAYGANIGLRAYVKVAPSVRGNIHDALAYMGSSDPSLPPVGAATTILQELYTNFGTATDAANGGFVNGGVSLVANYQQPTQFFMDVTFDYFFNTIGSQGPTSGCF